MVRKDNTVTDSVKLNNILKFLSDALAEVEKTGEYIEVAIGPSIRHIVPEPEPGIWDAPKESGDPDFVCGIGSSGYGPIMQFVWLLSDGRVYMWCTEGDSYFDSLDAYRADSIGMISQE